MFWCVCVSLCGGLLGVNVTTYAGSVVTYTMELSNVGDISSTWALTLSPDYPWLSAEPMSGFANARTVVDTMATYPETITVTLDLTGFSLGWTETAPMLFSATTLPYDAEILGSVVASMAQQPELTGLTFSTGVLSPRFVGGTFTYTLNVDFIEEYVTVRTAFEAPTEAVAVLDAWLVSGESSSEIELPVGTTQVPPNTG